MGALLGKEKPLKEVLRENKRMINRAVRELDRERAGLEREEKRITVEIKKMAKEQQMGAVKVMAKDLVRTRAHITKFIEMRSHLQSCGLKLQTVKSHQAMADAMKNTTKAMMKMNKAVNAPAISKMMADFERENMRSEMMQEIMGEMLDEAMEEPGDEEETDKIVSQVLDEIGISFGEEIPVGPALGTGTEVTSSSAPQKVSIGATGGGGSHAGGGNHHGSGGTTSGDSTLNDLEARLNNLNNGN
jgi:charged multivesicular body protein 2A